MTKEEIKAREEFAERMMYQHCNEHGLDTPNHIIKDALRIGFDAGAEWMQSKADDMIKETIKMVKPKWISVNDRLPEGNVIVIDAYGEVNVAYYDDSIEGFWLSCDGTAEIIADVTHWMPLPTPPSK